MPPVLNSVKLPTNKLKSKLFLSIITAIGLFLLIAAGVKVVYLLNQQGLKNTAKSTPSPMVQKQTPTPALSPTTGNAATVCHKTAEEINPSIEATTAFNNHDLTAILYAFGGDATSWGNQNLDNLKTLLTSSTAKVISYQRGTMDNTIPLRKDKVTFSISNSQEKDRIVTFEFAIGKVDGCWKTVNAIVIP